MKPIVEKPEPPLKIATTIAAIGTVFGIAALTFAFQRDWDAAWKLVAAEFVCVLLMHWLKKGYDRRVRRYLATVCTITLCFACQSVRADYILEFTAPAWCKPCREQAKDVNLVRSEGYDVRPVDYDKCPALVAYYTITKLPTCVYVVEIDGKSYDSGARIVGKATAGQLRRFCVMPGVVTVGAATRNAVRGLFCPMLWEW